MKLLLTQPDLFERSNVHSAGLVILAFKQLVGYSGALGGDRTVAPTCMSICIHKHAPPFISFPAHVREHTHPRCCLCTSTTSHP